MQVPTEQAMNGYQLTFYTEQDRRHGAQTLCEWLLAQIKHAGIRGATVIHAAQGVGHAGAHHAAHFIALADQPVQIIVAATEDEAARLMEVVVAAQVHLFYTKVPIEFGTIGGAKPGTHFDWRHPLSRRKSG